jgi:hypothetical protein
VAAGSFAGVLRFIQAGEGYTDVHTLAHPAGEIRNGFEGGEDPGEPAAGRRCRLTGTRSPPSSGQVAASVRAISCGSQNQRRCSKSVLSSIGSAVPGGAARILRASSR